jgi:sulfoxide reductase heme-binding subunit YedZ
VRTKTVLFCVALVPVLSFANDYAAAALARPWATLIDITGDWSIRFLIAGLCLSPLARLTAQPGFTGFRRMVGLFGAFYAALHVFAWTRQYGFDWPFLAGELVLRRYLTIGAIAVLCLVPLAATSPGAMHRALGPTRWRRLHTLMYPAVAAGFVHYAMARGLGRIEVAADGLILGLALAARLWRRRPAAIVR